MNLSERKVLHQEIYDILRQQILDGELSSGERIYESKIAEEMGTSRTPVREAIHKLKIEGLVNLSRNGALIVVENTYQDARELFELRVALETYVGRLAAQKIEEEDLEKLEQNLAYTRLSLEQEDLEMMAKLNTEFHEVIMSACENNKLINILNTYKEHIKRYRKKTLEDFEQARKSLEAHKTIVEALKERDPDRVSEEIRKHIIVAKKAVLKSLNKNND